MDAPEQSIARAVRPVITPFALVAIPVRESVDAAAVPLVVLPLAFVPLPVGGGVEALAVPLSPEHLSHVLREYAVVEPLHGPAAGGAAVWATAAAPCYNVPRCVPGVPHPAAGAGVD